MPSPIYATNSDIIAYLGTDSPIGAIDAASLLRTASMLVRRATRRDRYEIDLRTGLPSNPDYLAAMRDATVAQALAWNKLRIDPLAGGADASAPITSRSLGGASFSTGQVSAAAQDTKDALASGTVLSVMAAMHLRDVGLMSGVVGVNGSGSGHVVYSPLAATGRFPETVEL